MRSIELFAGIGGIALAAEWAGIETVAFCEREPFCQKVLNKHWSGVPIFDDVRTLNRKVLEERGVIEVGGTVDIISGGFPCQPFSSAGKQRGKEDDRDLWPEMFRIIEELKPRWIVGENVANFVNMELDRTLFDLESIGYRWRTFVIPACAVNAKHRRERTFIVAYSDGSGRLYREIEKFPAKKREYAQCELITSGSDVANTTSFGLSGPGQFIQSSNTEKNPKREASKSFNVRIPSEWEPEPGMARVANGIPDQVDRIKSLGNAVVPQQIYPIFKYIMEIENVK